MSTLASEDATTGHGKRYLVPRGILAITMLLTGAAGLIYEYVLSTVFSYLFGSTIEQFSITIGIMFAMMGIGGWLQTQFRGSLVEFFIGAELLLVLLGGFAPIVLQWTFAEMPDDVGWIKFVYPAAIGILIGIEIPLVMRINQEYSKNLSANIASTWAFDYIGGALGVIAWVWFLRRGVPLTNISFWTASANFAVALLSLVYFWRVGLLRGWRRRLVMSVSAALVGVLVAIGVFNANTWSSLITQRLYADAITFETTTKYQNLVITKGVRQAPLEPDYRLYLNGNLQFSSVDEAIYHEALVHPAMNIAASRRNVLVLGGGDGLALREVLKYKDVDSVTLVDLDPAMIKLAKTHSVLRQLNQDAFGDARVHSSLDQPRLNAGVAGTDEKQDVFVSTGKKAEPDAQKVASVDVYTIDADRFVSAKHSPYDVVIIDLPDPNSVELAKLYSQEFYYKVRASMSPQGILVVQSTSPYHAKEAFLCIGRTLKSAGLGVVPIHDNVPSFGDWGWYIGSPSLSSSTLRERLEGLGKKSTFGVPTQQLEPHSMARLLDFSDNLLQADNHAISTLMQPVVFGYYQFEGWKVE